MIILHSTPHFNKDKVFFPEDKSKKKKLIFFRQQHEPLARTRPSLQPRRPMPLAKGHFSLKFTSCRCQITAAGFLRKSALT